MIKVDALILRQKSKPVFSWYVDVNDQWFLVRNSNSKPTTAISYFNRKL